MTNLRRRLFYFCIGVVLGSTCLYLSAFFASFAIQAPSWKLVLTLCGIAILFNILGVVMGTAIVAAFRNPPWWIVTPERMQKSREFMAKRK